MAAIKNDLPPPTIDLSSQGKDIGVAGSLWLSAFRGVFGDDEERVTSELISAASGRCWGEPASNFGPTPSAAISSSQQLPQLSVGTPRVIDDPLGGVQVIVTPPRMAEAE